MNLMDALVLYELSELILMLMIMLILTKYNNVLAI